MIPHRMLSYETSGSGLKNRVSACRKRLRENRVTQKPHALDEASELFPETVTAVPEYRDYLTTPATHGPHIRQGHGRTEGHEPERVELSLVEGVEVGIT